MKTHPAIIRCALFLCLTVSPLFGEEPSSPKSKQELQGEEAVKLMVEKPTPLYPVAARTRGMEGTGSYWLDFNAKSGRVDAVKIVKSAGYAELDNAAVSTFYRWRCRAGQLDSVIVPAIFTLDRLHRSIGIHSY